MFKDSVSALGGAFVRVCIVNPSGITIDFGWNRRSRFRMVEFVSGFFGKRSWSPMIVVQSCRWARAGHFVSPGILKIAVEEGGGGTISGSNSFFSTKIGSLSL